MYRKNKSKLILLLVTILLVIVIGFAYLSDSLNIRGTSKVTKEEWDIHFENPTPTANSNVEPTVAPVADPVDKVKSISYNVQLEEPGDIYEFVVDIKNGGTLDGMVKLITSTISINGAEAKDATDPANIPSYLNYYVKYINGDPIEVGNVLAASAVNKAIVHVEYVDGEDLPEEDTNFTFTFSPEYGQSNGSAVATVDYQVIHRYKKLNGTYDDETETLRGDVGDNVTPPIKGKTGFVSPQTQTVEVKADGSTTVTYIYERETYTVSFDTDGASSVENQEITYGEKVTKPDDPTKQSYRLDNWYTTDSYDTVFDFDNTILTSNTTIYAKMVPKDLLCRLATSLHTETCERTSSGCYAAGYHENGSKGTTTITYGTIATSSAFTPGDAYDCDVNGDGTYSPTDERFYYLRNNGANEVLIYNSNFEGSAGPKNENIYPYDGDTGALNMLPTTDNNQWKNVEVTFDNKAARFPSRDDIIAACGQNITEAGDLDSCNYLLENTRYRSTTLGRTAIWLMKEDTTLYRIHSTDRKVAIIQSTSNNGARPVIEVPTALVEKGSDTGENVRITFDPNGGTVETQYKDIRKNTNVGSLPVPVLEDHTFIGWYTDNTWATKVEESTIVTQDLNLIAKWEEIEGVAKIGDTYYTTIQAAIDKVPTTNVETTIKVLKDVTLSSYLNINRTSDTNRNIIIDLQNHTVENADVVIENKTTLTIKNGKLLGTGNSGVINNNADGVLTIDNATIEANKPDDAANTKQAIYNNGGSLIVKNGSTLTSTSTIRGTLQNHVNTGEITILDCTIKSDGFNAIVNEFGTLTIGNKNGQYNNTTPVIQGAQYGITTDQDISIYDGVLKGFQGAINDELKITDIEEHSIKINDTEDISDVTYQRLYYNFDPTKNTITFEPNGGEVTPTYKIIDKNAAIGELPVPTKGIYTFTGWYTGLLDGVEIDETEVPIGNTTYYARWSYTPSHNQFNLNNDAMNVYYSNISTWKNDETAFQTNMDTNFNNFNCQECDSGYQSCSSAAKNLCDQPKGFDTGLDGELNVYTSSEANKEKGTLVSYTTSNDGIIYNMIPGNTYYWESVTDPNIHGTVTVSGTRRNIATTVRNVRDIGGLEVDTNNDGVVDGRLKYGRIYRGAKLSGNQIDASNLEKLGITEEIDLRAATDGANDAKLTNYQNRQMTNYEIDYTNYPDNYAAMRNVVTQTMQDIVNKENVYFHCKIGTDRTGTLAYFLEGLLGVSEEDRLQDYELSYFYGLLNRHRFYSYQAGSSITHRFVYMHNLYPTNASIYEWYMHGSTNTTADEKLIADFREEMINSN